MCVSVVRNDNEFDTENEEVHITFKKEQKKFWLAQKNYSTEVMKRHGIDTNFLKMQELNPLQS